MKRALFFLVFSPLMSGLAFAQTPPDSTMKFLPCIHVSLCGELELYPPGEYLCVDKEPVFVNQDEFMKSIVYPEIAKQNGVEGKVFVRICISEKGKYVKHQILRSADDSFTAEVESKIINTVFTPAMMNGQPVAASVVLPVNFVLH